LVKPQNQGGGGFPDLGLKTGRYGFLVWASKSSRLRFIDCVIKLMGGSDGVGHASRSSGLLHVEASQVEDGRVDVMGCVRLCYPCFAVFTLLGPRGIVVI
jgi:hypothetical protein